MARKSGNKAVYRVVFLQQGQVYELYAGEVTTAGLFGFLEVADLRFGRSEIIADPSEERLQKEFAGVNRFFIPYHAVIRIDEVEKAGTNRIATPEGGAVMPFPMALSVPRRPDRS